MYKAGFSVGRMFLGVLAASMLGVAMLAVPAAGSTSTSTCTGSGEGSGAGSCSLAFVKGAEPAGTAAGAVITSAFASQGGPVKVEVVDASGQLVTGSNAVVTVAIKSNPGSGSLSGTVKVTVTGGIASFSNLSISKHGIGYTLTATSTGIKSATSTDFTIWGSLRHCSTTPCSASSSLATTAGTVTTSSAASTAFLGSGMGGVAYTCVGTYRPVSEPFTFDVLSSSGEAQSSARFTASLEINKSTVQSSGHPGAASWQICYASQASFTALDGTSSTTTIGGMTYNTGLLPDCSKTQGAPCVKARHKDNAGDVIIAFLASGDPVGRA